MSNYQDLIEAQSYSNWAPIAIPLFVDKSIIADYQRVTNSLIFAIFATTGNFVSVEVTQQRYRMLKSSGIFVVVEFSPFYSYDSDIIILWIIPFVPTIVDYNELKVNNEQ